MKSLSAFIVIIAGAAGLFAQTPKEVVFTFHHKVGTETLQLGHTLFPIWNGKNTQLTRAEFYISEIELIRADSSVVPLQDAYLLVNVENPRADYRLGQWDVSNVIGVNLHIGVDSAHNHLDPSTYPDEHPLANQKNSMHWGWVAGYRFMAIEGVIDNNNDGAPETDLQFHNIGDPLYKTVRLSCQGQAQNDTLRLNFDLDYARLFQDIPMTGNLILHGSEPVNDQMMENAAHRDFIRPVQVSAAPQLPDLASQINIAPNPASGTTLIAYDLAGNAALTLVLTNALGQTVRRISDQPASGAVRWDAAGLTNGLYQLAFYQNGRFLVAKPFVVQH